MGSGYFAITGAPIDYASPHPPQLHVSEDGQFVIVLGSIRTTIPREESRSQAEALIERQRQVP